MILMVMLAMTIPDSSERTFLLASSKVLRYRVIVPFFFYFYFFVSHFKSSVKVIYSPVVIVVSGAYCLCLLTEA